MPSPRPYQYRTVTERSMSFNGRGAVVASPVSDELKRPRTVPDLMITPASGSGLGLGLGLGLGPGLMRKVLINVNVEGSVGPVQVIGSMDNSVAELILVVVKQYIKDGRRPIISVQHVDHFDLHYSPFSLECLDREEKLATLGSRNFFMCKRRTPVEADAPGSGCNNGGASSSCCSKQAGKVANHRSANPWLKLMSFLSA